MRFQFSHPWRASFSGFVDVFPWALRLEKIGDSFILSRM